MGYQILFLDSSVGRAVDYSICPWFESRLGDSELGELVEWLIQQIANLSMRKRCVGSIPTLSAKLVFSVYCQPG